MVAIGDDTGLEQSVQERLFEPLVHVVRNSVSHGIESSEVRLQQGKSGQGTITLKASATASMLVIEVADDGAGLNYDAIRKRGLERGLVHPGNPVTEDQLAKLIFHPGFSTRDTASQVSGRGVGMDVVATTIDRMQGRIDIDSRPGQGTTFRIRIPLTTGIEHVMVFRAAGQFFALPMRAVRSANPSQSDARHSVCLARAFGFGDASGAAGGDASLLLDEELELKVDHVVGADEVVVRPLPEALRSHPLVTGVIRSASGELVLVLDGESTRDWCYQLGDEAGWDVAKGPESGSEAHQAATDTKQHVLIVDDSVSSRVVMKRMLTDRGYCVSEAEDGLHAMEVMRRRRFDLIISDLDMPRMNGFELVREIARESQGQIPTVVSSSRAKDVTWDSLKSSGVLAYMQKPVSPDVLDSTLESVFAASAS